MENKTINESEKSDVENLRALIKRTDKENPKPEDLSEIKKLLDKDSSLVKINELSQVAYDRFLKTVSSSALMNELSKRQIEEKRESLGYNAATTIEKMLIDQIILCGFRLNHLEIIYTGKLEDSHSLEHGIYWDKRLSSAQRRFIRACESLAKVRKLLAEAELREQQARNKRSQSTLIAQKILENATK